MMASKAFFMMVIVAMAAAPALATDYMVGDNAGWTVNYDYTAWAAGKDFRVGDTLMFMYTKGSDNVVKVNATDFKACASTNANTVPLTTGNDTISLMTTGKKWYISTIGDHCSKGMKLVITVGAEGPIPPPVPGTSAAGEVSPLKSSLWVVAVGAAYRMIMA